MKILQDHFIDIIKLKQDLKQKYHNDLEDRILVVCKEDR